MKKAFFSFASLVARALPEGARQALYRFPFLSRMIRGSINAAVPAGLSVVEVAAGMLKGSKVLIDLKTEKSRWLGTYEPELQQALTEYLTPGMTVYDVGANIGYVSLMISRVVGETGKVFAFEALPGNVDRIQRNVELNQFARNISVISSAVIDRVSPVEFFVHSQSIGMGKAAGSAGRGQEDYREKIQVPGVSLDEFVFERGNPAPDAVKMDIEGGEVLALPGMRRVLETFHPVMFLELHGPESEQSAWDNLCAAGYTLRAMQPGFPIIDSPASLGWKAYVIATAR